MGQSPPRGSRALSYHDDGFLHVWECPKVLGGHNPEFLRCGYITHGPGTCPYDHGEAVELVEIVAVVQCSDCGDPIPRDDSRSPGDRLICSGCTLSYIAQNAYKDGAEHNDPGARR